MWIDLHAHLFDYEPGELFQVLQRARERSVRRIVAASVNLETARRTLEHCRGQEGVHATLGISPFDVETLEPDWEQELTRRLQDGHVLGVGEIGLDDSNPRYPSLERQRPLFRRQLEIAHSLDLPVIMHSRGAEEEVIDTCRELGISRAVFHCFTGTIDTLRRLLDAGYHVSWSGIITFKKSGLDEAVRFAPLDRLFIETDTPYLAPVPHRGKPNEPGLVSLVGEHVARLKDVPPQRVAEAIRKSFRAVFAPTTHTRQ